MTGHEPWAGLVDEATILEIHRSSIEAFGGMAAAGAKPGCVDGSLGAAWHAEAYTRQHQAAEGLAFAAYLGFYLMRNHCFTDGNKRVGWVTLIYVLDAYSLRVRATTDEAYAMCDGVATGRITSGQDVAIWLAERVEARI